MHAELRELRALIEQRLPAVPAPESDPPIGEYNAATDRYLVRMGALSAIWPRMARRHRPGSRDDLARLVQVERDRRPYRLRISASSSLV